MLFENGIFFLDHLQTHLAKQAGLQNKKTHAKTAHGHHLHLQTAIAFEKQKANFFITLILSLLNKPRLNRCKHTYLFTAAAENTRQSLRHRLRLMVPALFL